MLQNQILTGGGKREDGKNADGSDPEKDCTERVGFGLWWRKVVQFFYIEATGEAILIEKTNKRNAISIYISVASSFSADYSCQIIRPPFQIPSYTQLRSFRNVAQLNPSILPSKFGSFPAKIRRISSWPRFSSAVPFFPHRNCALLEILPS